MDSQQQLKVLRDQRDSVVLGVKINLSSMFRFGFRLDLCFSPFIVKGFHSVCIFHRRL